MKILWLGWTGPEMNEFGQGAMQLSAHPVVVVTGSGAVTDYSDLHLPPHATHRPHDLDETFAILEAEAPDVIFYSDYVFSENYRPEIHKAFDDAGMVIWDDRWLGVKAFKILHDGESMTQEPYFRSAAKRFDGVMTYNHTFLTNPIHKTQFYTPPGVSEYFACIYVGDRDVDCVYSGTGLDEGYRGELADLLRRWAGDSLRIEIKEGAYEGWTYPQYRRMLYRAKKSLCTLAGGKRHIPKKRDLEALLCGAAPVVENDPEVLQLMPNVYRQLFGSFGDLARALDEPIDDRAIMESRQIIMDQWFHRHVFARCLQFMGLK